MRLAPLRRLRFPLASPKPEVMSAALKKNPRLSHLRADGTAFMVDVSDKAHSERTAVATGFLAMQGQTLRILLDGRAPKGDVLAVARVAGIQGAKKTADLVPMCHPLPLTHVAVDLKPTTRPAGVRIAATVKTVGRTGVEMEALTAVTCAGLALYDMLKAVDRAMVLRDVCVQLKQGGKGGPYVRRAPRKGLRP